MMTLPPLRGPRVALGAADGAPVPGAVVVGVQAARAAPPTTPPATAAAPLSSFLLDNRLSTIRSSTTWILPPDAARRRALFCRTADSISTVQCQPFGSRRV